MKRCHYCDGRFGLVRYHRFRKQFCSDTTRGRCKRRYLEGRGRTVIRETIQSVFARLARRLVDPSSASIYPH